ncbi:MAG: tyrosine-type recombinase/integrase [Microgenomates group bacterium]
MGQLITVKEAAEKFQEHLKKRKNAIATILAYSRDIGQMESFLKKKGVSVINAVTEPLLEELKTDFEKKGYSPKSVSRKINALKSFFRFLKEENLLEYNPAATLAHPKATNKPLRILTRLEYRALRDACRGNIRISAIVELMLQTGMKIGEISNLTLKDIKNDEIDIRPFESRPGRIVPLNKSAKEALQRYLAERPKCKTNFLFVTRTGKPLLVRNIRATVEKYLQEVGIKNVKLTDLRHTWAYYRLLAGTPITTVAKIAGHKRLTTTEKYLRLIEEKKEKPIKLEEL